MIESHGNHPNLLTNTVCTFGTLTFQCTRSLAYDTNGIFLPTAEWRFPPVVWKADSGICRGCAGSERRWLQCRSPTRIYDPFSSDTLWSPCSSLGCHCAPRRTLKIPNDKCPFSGTSYHFCHCSSADGCWRPWAGRGWPSACARYHSGCRRPSTCRFFPTSILKMTIQGKRSEWNIPLIASAKTDTLPTFLTNISSLCASSLVLPPSIAMPEKRFN